MGRHRATNLRVQLLYGKNIFRILLFVDIRLHKATVQNMSIIYTLIISGEQVQVLWSMNFYVFLILKN